ncbi:MAG TPA: lytic transglycosylase domain-containing protein [Steroidobacteraceae bacterium]|nr:lytic transglycosylase domain-containing protein [Steroidobacteraceae bacterium]
MRLSALVGIAFGAAAAAAQADIYAFTDAAGVVHVSNVPTDSRYELVLRAGPEAGSVKSAPGGRHVRSLSDINRFDGAIAGAARAARLDPALLRAVIAVESGFDAHAVSARGAKGLMQLEPGTARRYGVSDVFDPSENIRAGAAYLRDLLARFDSNLELALAAYNAGEDAVERHGRRVPGFEETRQYVPKVLGLYHSLLAQAQGG